MAKAKFQKPDVPRYPDEWAWGKGMLIKTDSKHPTQCVWEPYELPEDDNLILRVTMRIWGGSACFLAFKTPEERQACIDEDSRQATWRNAGAIAETLWRTALVHKEFVVLYCPEGQFGSIEELIRIYQRLS